MLFGKCLKISSVIFVLGVGVPAEFSSAKGQTTERTASEEQLNAERKGFTELASDGTAKNRNSSIKENPNSATDVVVTIGASSESPVKAAYVPRSLPFQNSNKLNLLEKAYLDAFSILSQENDCSKLYGGPLAIMALNELVKQLKPTHLNRNMGMRMFGPTTTVQHNPTGFMFRFFEKAELNVSGPFYSGNLMNEPHMPSIGGFLPNTREARVTLLLHELGHMVKGGTKGWLLPDDGADSEISRENTNRVVSACGKQIGGLSKVSVATELQRATNNVEQPDPQNVSPM